MPDGTFDTLAGVGHLALEQAGVDDRTVSGHLPLGGVGHHDRGAAVRVLHVQAAQEGQLVAEVVAVASAVCDVTRPPSLGQRDLDVVFPAPEQGRDVVGLIIMMLVILRKAGGEIILADPGSVDADFIDAACRGVERCRLDLLSLDLERTAQGGHSAVGRVDKDLLVRTFGRHTVKMIQEGIGLAYLPYLDVAHPGCGALLNQPSDLGELGVCNIVPAVTQRTYVNLSQIRVVKQDSKLTVGNGHGESGSRVNQQAVCHLEALKHFPGLVLQGVSRPVDVDPLELPVQLHLDIGRVPVVLDAHNVEVGVHQARIVAAHQQGSA